MEHRLVEKMAFTDGFALTMLITAGLLAAGAVVVWRTLSSGDVPPPPGIGSGSECIRSTGI